MKSARLFNCARCHAQVIICSHCDRGNFYCGSTCSQQARAQNHRIANQRYQKSKKGQMKNAERQRRYRQHQREKTKRVTDQGSPVLPPNDLLPEVPNEKKWCVREFICCHFCGEAVSQFLRNGYLRHHKNHQTHDFSSWPLGP
jgi:predicted GIY-YIG superfamily endonuclease